MRSGYEALARAVAGGAPLPGASPPAESSGGGAASTGQGSNPNPPAPPSVAGGGALRAPAPPAVAGAGSTERRAGPQKEKTLNCPRCNSTNTKFCYYNNYILQQPRYFCKTCHHYWTEGGSLRNVPVGGGSRKNNRSSSSSASASTSASVTSSSMASTAGAASKNPKLAHEGAQDLNLAFPHHGGLHAPEFAAFPSLESSHGNRAATYIFRGSRAKLNFPESATLRLPWAPQAAAAAPPPPPQKPEALQSLELNAQMRMLAAAGASPAPSPLAQGPHDTAASSSAPLRPDYDLEAGGQAHRVGGGAAAPVQQPPEVGAVMVQALAALLPTCMTAYPVLKDAPDYIKFTIFGGLAFTTLGLFIGTLSNSVARRGLAIRLVSFSAIAVLTFCTASQFSSRIYVALTALIGVVLNLIIMLLQF